MTKISEVMTPHCEWVSGDISVQDVARKMKELDCGFIPVGENEKLVGMITDRDIALRCVAEGKDPATCTAADIMTNKVFYCYDTDETVEVCQKMADVKVRRFPVMTRDKRLVGVISMGDLAQSVKFQETGQTLKDITAHDRQNRYAA